MFQLSEIKFIEEDIVVNVTSFRLLIPDSIVSSCVCVANKTQFLSFVVQFSSFSFWDMRMDHAAKNMNVLQNWAFCHTTAGKAFYQIPVLLSPFDFASKLQLLSIQLPSTSNLFAQKLHSVEESGKL